MSASNTLFPEYFAEQLRLHPYTEPRDAVKLCYQASFGAEHLLLDITAAREYFDDEFLAVNGDANRLFEQISPDYYRVNLTAWKHKSLPQSWLFEMFRMTAANGKNSGIQFSDCLGAMETLVKNNEAPFTLSAWNDFFQTYDVTAPTPVHHSETFRQHEHPAYRIVAAQYVKLIPILEKIAALASDTKVIAIDGRSASGKTTLAGTLCEITGGGVIHMDDFFLPAELRTEARLNTLGGNVHYERFLSEVIPNLRSGEAFHHSVFDCEEMQMGAPRTVAASKLRIVEGAYSNHPELGVYMDIRVFCDIASELQQQRIKTRDGDYAEVYTSRWIPMEEQYLSAFGIKGKADITIFAEQ